MEVRTEKIIDLYEWDKTVIETYGRPYSFQQQDGCKERQMFYFTVPEEANDYENTIVPEIVNDPKMGVSFTAWLERDPKQPLSGREDDSDWSLGLWWDRNFYPDVQMVANDLHAKGLLEAGDYLINIDW